jgi:hypothetical protein
MRCCLTKPFLALASGSAAVLDQLLCCAPLQAPAAKALPLGLLLRTTWLSSH